MIGEIEYYKKLVADYRSSFQIGHFYLAPIPYLLESTISYLTISSFDEHDFSKCEFLAKKIHIADLEVEKLPSMAKLGYAKGEFTPINKYKFRPVIAMSNPIPNWTDYEKQSGDCIVVIPLYSTKDETGMCKFRQRFLYKVQAYQYPSLFFLPEDERYDTHETIARLDRLAVVKTHCLKPKPIALSDDGFFCLSKWIQSFFGADLDNILADYQETAKKSIPST